MKKLFVMLLTLTILAVPVTAYGGEDTIGKNENRSIDVQAKYANGTDTPDVYSVNVAWGAMQFTYSAAGTRVWDPSKHQYTDNITTNWTADGDTVTVTNHSNKDVNVSFAYAKASGFEDVNGAFSVESKTLNAGTVEFVFYIRKEYREMKKIFAIIISLALLSTASVTAFAASPITAKDGSDSAVVKGTYVAGDASATVYSVDIAWGSMEFTYTDASKGTWNPDTHGYDGAKAATWSCATDANKIEVTNHSNANVTAQLSYAPESGYNGISGSFSDGGTLNLNSAVDTRYSAAPSGSATLSLTGDLASDTSVKTKIGVVTVTLVNE